MIEQFSAYRPSTWFDEAGLVDRGEIASARSRIEKASWHRWISSARFTQYVAVGAIAICSTMVGLSSAATNLFQFPPFSMSVDRSDRSLGEINQSFGKLFKIFRNGAPLPGM